MSVVTLYGPEWSAYTRTVRLVLEEKNCPYKVVDVDFSQGDMPAEHWLRHPFGKVPALQHNDFMIYETAAICRYIDEALDGPDLQPAEAPDRGRMAQIIAILDTYLSKEIRIGFVSELLIHPMMGLEANLQRADDAKREITSGFKALANCMGRENYMVGNQLTLADLHAAPLFDYLALTSGGKDIVASQPILEAWWVSIQTRLSIVNTQPDLSIFKRIGDGLRIKNS